MSCCTKPNGRVKTGSYTSKRVFLIRASNGTGKSERLKGKVVKSQGYIRNIGNALMVPVATLPVPAILIGIGHWIRTQNTQVFNPLAELLIKSGCAITDNMPVIFALGIAFGLSRDKNGSAALTGFIAYLILTTLCSPGAVMLFRDIYLDYEQQAFSHINNLFSGMLTGVLSAAIYNRYSRVTLPSALSFLTVESLCR